MSKTTATIRVFAFLHDVRRERGEASRIELEVPPSGVSAFEIATRLGLPLELVGGAFVNGALYSGDVVIRPGDRVGMMPTGTPAFHPAFFGARKAS